MAHRARGSRILDVGCGHGVLSALLAFNQPERHVRGIDPDTRKIDWARRSVGALANTRFEVMDVAHLAELEPASFDTVCIADVLYVLPVDHWPQFLRACHALLRRGGQLLLKEAEDDGGWRTRKALWQEQLMVRVFGRTHSSGAIGFLPRQNTERLIQQSGFNLVETVALSAWSTTPHVLFIGDKE